MHLLELGSRRLVAQKALLLGVGLVELPWGWWVRRRRAWAGWVGARREGARRGSGMAAHLVAEEVVDARQIAQPRPIVHLPHALRRGSSVVERAL